MPDKQVPLVPVAGIGYYGVVKVMAEDKVKVRTPMVHGGGELLKVRDILPGGGDDIV